MKDDADIDKKLISIKDSFGKEGFKYFISYKYDDYKFNLLRIMLPKISEYVKCFDETKYMSFSIKGDKLQKLR